MNLTLWITCDWPTTYDIFNRSSTKINSIRWQSGIVTLTTGKKIHLIKADDDLEARLSGLQVERIIWHKYNPTVVSKELQQLINFRNIRSKNYFQFIERARNAPTSE